MKVDYDFEHFLYVPVCMYLKCIVNTREEPRAETS